MARFGGGYNGGGGGGNMQQLMKQAQKLQKDMEKAQEELETMTVEASSGGGAVKVIFTGAKVLEELTIEPDVVDPNDVDMLKDLIIAAINEGLKKVEDLSQEKLGKYTNGLGGFF
ncbi:MAG: YbaB/EbfC family nucleoid-associated protein [Clostridiales bacterium]|jgi:DNA-binding YbaB/EbfC family protein|nr:YbaB/EbfC family nucleoid-associated protein [Clostridiales bacterium]